MSPDYIWFLLASPTKKPVSDSPKRKSTQNQENNKKNNGIEQPVIYGKPFFVLREQETANYPR